MKKVLLKKSGIVAVLGVAVMLLIGTTHAYSQEKQARKISAEVAKAFENGQLRKLDAKKLVSGKLRLTIENSIGEPEFEHYSFKSFTALGRWIKSQEFDGMPNKVAWPLVGCRSGVCTFHQDGGILHNQLYLTKVRYTYRNKRIYIHGIQLLAG